MGPRLKICKLIQGVVLLCAILYVQIALSASPALTGKVVRVYDGDTIKVENVGKVRLIGIDTPEFESSDRDQYYLRQGISEPTLRRIASESREFIFRNIVGGVVVLTTDRETYDRHGRLLAYVHLPDGRLLNRTLLEEGLAAVYRRFDFKLKSDFIKAEKSAKQKGLGMWSELEAGER